MIAIIIIAFIAIIMFVIIIIIIAVSIHNYTDIYSCIIAGDVLLALSIFVVFC